MGLRCNKTQIVYRYVSQYILSDSHGRIYNVRDWDNLQVPALAYDSLYRVVCILVGHELNTKLVGKNKIKKTFVSL